MRSALQKLKFQLPLSKVFAFVGLVFLIAISYSSPLSVLNAQAPAVTQGYGTDSTLERGMIVRLKDGDPSKIVALNAKDIESMHGIVIDPNDAPVTISSDTTKTFVATIGRYDVLVSDQNGPIKEGDLVTISSFNGVGMKATDEQTVIAGRALGEFNGKDGVVSSAIVKTTKGAETKVYIGRVQVDIGIARNPRLRTNQRGVPAVLQRITDSIANKPVTALKIYISLAILLISTAIAGSMLYAGIRSAIVAIGRNPLSKRSITKSLIQVILTAIIVFIIGLFAVYLLLKL
jgi:hypothetical protein